MSSPAQAGCKNVLDYLYRSASELPDKEAVADENEAMTFKQLLQATERVGTALAKDYGGKNAPIAVLVDRDIKSLVALLGIVQSGNFYVPIDATQPPARINLMLGQMQPSALIAFEAGLPDGLDLPSQCSVIEYGQLASSPIDQELLESIRSAQIDTDPLYAICTSGSTGTPKGVLISHRSVLDFIPEFAKEFDFDSNERFGNQAPFDFDVSVKDIYTTLYCGAFMYIIPRKCFAAPKLLMDVLDEQEINAITWAVSALCVVSGLKALNYRRPAAIRKVLFSGEAMPVRDLNVWREAYPDALFVNLYGPTEITCNCLFYKVAGEYEPGDRLPLGNAFANERVLYLNEKNEEIKDGETGEICVLGTCLALGYYRDSERTAIAFVQNPLNDSYPELMYRTGDLAARVDGQYYYSARKDFQIKHMGHRIELEEIELCMNAVPGIVRACCLFDEGRNKIVACYEGESERQEIVQSLGEHLPKYMVPNVFHKIDSMPITKNGKMDRAALRTEFI